MPSAVKLALEDLLKTQRLQADGPPLRGEDRRGTPLATGVPGLDELLFGKDLFEDAQRPREALGLRREGTHRFDGLATRADDAFECGFFLLLIGDRRIGLEREALQQRLDGVSRLELAELRNRLERTFGIRNACAIVAR